MGYFDDPRGRRAEELAFAAEQALRRNDPRAAREAYAQAAALETEVARSIPRAEERIRGVLGVSAAALWLKAGDLAQAAALSAEFLAEERLPQDSRERLLAIQQQATQTRRPALRLVLEDWNLTASERRLIESALETTDSLVEAAGLLGLTRHALKRRIIKHRIEWPRARGKSVEARSPRPRTALS